MLRAISMDWARLPDWEVVVCWDTRFGHWDIPSITARGIEGYASFMDAWQSIALEVDFVLVIAPEIDNELATIIRKLRKSAGCLLNADDCFLTAASDKWMTAQSFMQAGILHPSTFLLNDFLEHGIQIVTDSEPPERWVIKPRDGAGCLGVKRFDSLFDLEHAMQSKVNANRYILQPWIQGIAASVAVLCGAGEQVVLPAMYQNIVFGNPLADQNLQYLGGRGPWQSGSQITIEAFAKSVISALPGSPRGWVGIDFVQSMTENNEAQLVAIEVNPRLTTSYIGLREIVVENLADLLFQTAIGQKVRYSCSGSSIAFDSFGKPDENLVY